MPRNRTTQKPDFCIHKKSGCSGSCQPAPSKPRSQCLQAPIPEKVRPDPYKPNENVACRTGCRGPTVLLRHPESGVEHGQWGFGEHPEGAQRCEGVFREAQVGCPVGAFLSAERALDWYRCRFWKGVKCFISICLYDL